MPKKNSYPTVTDQFCGAGGSSIGATRAGATLKLGLNHWQLAIETHNSNFPNADHDCTDISACDPRKYPSTDILITSPECTNHSLAKGKPRKWQKQLEMFGKVTIDPSEERSRATMWDVPRFAEYHHYNIVVVENVVEARMWVMWDAWLHAMSLLGYDHQCVYFNSMFAHPTPQSRDRMYVVFWKHGNKKPNLDITPRAYCHHCGHDVDSVQSWKPGRSAGRYKKQYQYCCPTCASVVEPYYYCAANAIDWSLPIQRIGDREKPLKASTIKRIQRGLDKFAGAGYLIVLKDSRADDAQANRPLGFDEPLSTIVASASQHGLVLPFVAALRGQNAPKEITDALDTLAASGNHHGVVIPPYLIETQWGQAQNDRSTGVLEPLPTQTTGQGKAIIIPPFLTSYYGQTQNTGLEGEMPKVEDCGFRMLEPEECGKAMAFPSTYKVMGNKRQRVKQYGNAVTPPVMEVLIQRCIESMR